MISTAMLFVLLLIATVTDIRQRRIFNWTCYPGILAALALSTAATWYRFDNGQGTNDQIRFWGIVSLSDSVAGFFVCAAAMLVCYVLFPGGVGGGDVKLMAMVGAFLGINAGLEVMLWTFILGGCQALITLVWKYGVGTIVRRTSMFLWLALRTRTRPVLTEHERRPFQTDLFLSPSALLAFIIVHFRWIEWFSSY